MLRTKIGVVQLRWSLRKIYSFKYTHETMKSWRNQCWRRQKQTILLFTSQIKRIANCFSTHLPLNQRVVGSQGRRTYIQMLSFCERASLIKC